VTCRCRRVAAILTFSLGRRNLVSHDIFIGRQCVFAAGTQADDGVLSWLGSFSEVGATLVVYRVSVAESTLRVPSVHRATGPPQHSNVSLHTAAFHDAMLALYQCARARWLATSGDSCQCMTGRDDFRSTLSRVSAGRCRPHRKYRRRIDYVRRAIDCLKYRPNLAPSGFGSKLILISML